MSNDASQTRSRKAITVVGLAGITGGLVLGGTLVATAADPSGFQNTALSCLSPQPVIPTVTPYFATVFSARNKTVSGSIPAPTAAQLAGATATQVQLRVTTQYDSAASGGLGKADQTMVTLANQSFRNPIGGTPGIPPVINGVLQGPGTAAYSAKTTGRAAARITVEAFVAAATRPTATVVLAATCPAGSTQTAFLEGQNNARPGAPLNASATPGSSTTTAADSGTAPNNGTATVSFTKGPDNGTQINRYSVRANDVTDPAARDQFGGVEAKADGTPKGPATVTKLNTTHNYTFTVSAVTDQDQFSLPSNTTNQVKPVPGSAP